MYHAIRHLRGEIPLKNQMDIEMKGMNVFDNEPMVAVGRLEKLWTLRKGSSPATGLPGDIPVLTCPIAASDALCLESNNRQSCFGFGRIQLDESVLMTIRLQLGPRDLGRNRYVEGCATRADCVQGRSWRPMADQILHAGDNVEEAEQRAVPDSGP
jgi:hypothetical protein